jgi:cell wall-associated NlpC family hydrolase
LLPSLSAQEISDRLTKVISFIQKSMAIPNEYLWGGTVAPNYDCSGLMQAAFASVDIWIPRDAYQQESFAKNVNIKEIQVGDLIFFGNPTKATHVGIYIGNGEYIHSSGKEHGHNGIAISELSGLDQVSQWYAKQLRGVGRITTC